MSELAGAHWPLKGEFKFDTQGGPASIRFVEEERTIHVDTVFVPAAGRRAGIGSELLVRVLMLADQLGKDVRLSARPLSVSGPEVLPRLVAWYESFGFRAVSRDSGKVLMVRASPLSSQEAGV